MDEQEIRAELGEILDQLADLAPDAFAERVALHDRQEELRAALADVEIPGAEEIAERWAEQAGSKLPEDEGKPVIVSPTEGAGGAV